MKKAFLAIMACALFVAACDDKKNQSSEATESGSTMVAAPAFSGDSAYAFIEQQLAFGPRVPNTPAHVRGGDYIAAKLKAYGCEVTEQPFTAKAWDGTIIKGRNIIGSINPAAAKRILFSSHWDSRPRADNDSLAANHTKPVAAANDGASGVAVLLEMARTIQQAKTKPTVGIDLVFFDAEDWGDGDEVTGDREAASGDFDYIGFCLGSRHWAKNPHKPGYTAYYGVLLDMVGAKGATFMKEGYSMQYAPSVVQTVWNTASQLGFGQYFVDANGGAITDDHMAPNLIAKIPMIDIIHTSQVGGFFPDWHTTEDDMRNIDRGTLKAVGQTLIQVAYNEQPNAA
ncbi:M28 family peptidase [Fibrella sp. WM1]|uniref:M28 family peptidase n=1 Tax=Fibrella musci TaxID=3242485 RepID=UPI00351FD321